jgi:hypothetical protein
VTNLPQTEPENKLEISSPQAAPLTPNAWHERADDLARWALERLVNRTDVWGAYLPDGKPTTRPPREERGSAWLGEDGVLLRHFRADGPQDVVGLHSTNNYRNTARWGAVDIDNHGTADPGANLRAALHWHDCLVRRGFRPLLTDSNGKGGYHLRVLLRSEVEARQLYHFMRGVVADHGRLGLKAAPETFPKQESVGRDEFGNWLRLPGRHHKREHYSRVWDGSTWLEGEAAVQRLLAHDGDDPGLLPEDCKLDHRARALMATFSHLAEGEGRNSEAYKLLAGLVSADGPGLDDEAALAYAEEWDGGNTPPLGRGALEGVLANARRYLKNDGGAVLPATPAPTVSQTRPPRPDPAAYYGPAGEFVRRVEPETEADPVAVLAQFLVMAGSILDRTVFFRVGKTRHHANLFLNLVGDTSEGRKGTGLDFARDHARQVDEGWARACLLDGNLSSGEGLTDAVCDPVYKTCRKKNAATGAEEEYRVLEKEGVADKRLLVVGAEFGGVLAAMRREGNTLSSVLRAAWDGLPLRPVTKNNKTQATDAHVSVIGHITAEELRRKMSDDEKDNGLVNRFLWVYSTRSKLLPDGGNDVDVSDIATEIAGAVRRVREQTASPCFQGVTRDPGASGLWHDVYAELTAGRPGAVGRVLSRAAPLTMRLAMIYAALDGGVVVTREHLEAALALWRYCEASARWAFGGETACDPTAERILAALRAAGPRGLTRTEVSKTVFKGHARKQDLDRAFTLLADAGLARQVQGGRWVAAQFLGAAAAELPRCGVPCGDGCCRRRKDLPSAAGGLGVRRQFARPANS